MSDCGHVYKNGCYSCLETKIDKIENKIDKLLMYKTSEAGYKDGYKEGVRNMWEAMKLRCDENFFNEVAENGCEHLECTFKTCPIAQKLLKGVK
jgi:hypothetical protein